MDDQVTGIFPGFFGYIFHLAAFLAAVYALHVRDTVQHVAAMTYVGSAIGAVFAMLASGPVIDRLGAVRALPAPPSLHSSSPLRSRKAEPAFSCAPAGTTR